MHLYASQYLKPTTVTDVLCAPYKYSYLLTYLLTYLLKDYNLTWYIHTCQAMNQDSSRWQDIRCWRSFGVEHVASSVNVWWTIISHVCTVMLLCYRANFVLYYCFWQQIINKLLLLLLLRLFVTRKVPSRRPQMRCPAVRKCICLYTMYHINSNVFSFVLKVVRLQSDIRNAVGNLFHTEGPETAKLLSP